MRTGKNSSNNKNRGRNARRNNGGGWSWNRPESTNADNGWQHYAAMPINALRFIVARFLLAKELLSDSRTPFHVKGLLVALVIYIFSPFDFIPDMIPFLGITDDLALLALGWSYAERFATQDMYAKVEAILQRWN